MHKLTKEQFEFIMHEIHNLMPLSFAIESEIYILGAEQMKNQIIRILYAHMEKE